MNSLSIRGLDDDLSEHLKKVASSEQKSVNQFVIDVLKQRLGMDKPKKFSSCYSDLDQLFGSWGNAQFDSIQEKINAERQIDDELWK